ncbi:hypothetical protein [Aquibacillus salsiterrae]|uniref:Uncharacterized protein n=1 Tax=Aquibacillus salsiterrae TaxID=2950439 RepID=A0A9X3WFV4_9BACI|nr:hypothetical protein [Aquibacillus salsiterrae]MDC3416684.1 hypothetical protein [Aquibacillus salsiterrae]
MDDKKEQEKPPKHFVEKLTKHVGEATRNNIAYLQQTIPKLSIIQIQ